VEKLNQFETALLHNNHAFNTINMYVSTIKSYYCWLQKMGIKEDESLKNSNILIKSYMKHILLNDKVSIYTANSKITAFRKYNELVLGNEDSFDLPYLPEIDINYRNSLVSTEVVDLVYRIKRIKDKSVLFLHLYGGLTVSEVCELRVEDIIDGSIYIKDSRIIPIHKKLESVIDQYMKYKHITYENDGPKKVFYTTRGEISPSGVFRIARKYSTEKREYTPTILRNTFFNELMKRNIKLNVIYYLMGKNVVYFDLPHYDELKDAIESINFGKQYL